MRRVFTVADALAAGVTPAALRWGERNEKWRRVERGVYAEGPADPTPMDRAIATVVATGGVASGQVAGALLGLDSVMVTGPDVTVAREQSGRRVGVRRRDLDPARIVVIGGVRCTGAVQTLLDLAALLDDARWEQALESALRTGAVSVAELEAACGGTRGAARVQRVLAARPAGAPPTESLLETLMVQLARTVELLPVPVRQREVVDAHGAFVARVDLAWPDLGLFVELDGQHHAGQPVYDARRETAVVAATGWLCARFTWTEVVRFPRSTARRLADVAAQAAKRAPAKS